MNTDKNLLVDYIPFDITPQMIKESMEQNNGRVIIAGILQRAGAKNQNGRVYPKNILEREVEKYKKQNIANRSALGELDHPDSSVINLKNVCHNIVRLWWENDSDLHGELELLDTPSGNIAKKLFEAGIRVGISSRGLGSVKPLTEDENTVVVQPDFDLLCWDLVSSPSTQGAFMHPLKEGFDPMNQVQASKYFKVNQLINEILRGE